MYSLQYNEERKHNLGLPFHVLRLFLTVGTSWSGVPHLWFNFSVSLTLFTYLFIYGLPVELFNELRFDCDRAFFPFISLFYPPTVFVLTVVLIFLFVYIE